MKKEELLKLVPDTKKELCDSLILFYGFEPASEDEKKEWPYKSELAISLKNIIGKELFFEDKYIGLVTDCFFGKSDRGHNSVRVKVDDKECSITGSKVKMYDKFDEKEILVDLHPSRKGIKFWSFGYIASEKSYKSLYYKTNEYRGVFEKTLNENLGTIGLRAPIQSKQIKDKISNTIEERYGSKWFLSRGSHYSAVTISMQEKFGVDNLFFSDEWQIENSKNVNRNLGESSNLEQEIIKELEILGLKDSYYFLSDKGQKVIIVNKNKFYKLDYYNSQYNIVIEIMGDYWHCNPMLYEHNFYHKQKKKLANEVWIDDRKRKNEIINILGCNFIEVWERDWKNNRENILMHIKSQIQASTL